MASKWYWKNGCAINSHPAWHILFWNSRHIRVISQLTCINDCCGHRLCTDLTRRTIPKIGMTERRDGGMAESPERRKIPRNPKRRSDRMTERQNRGNDGMTERWNGRKPLKSWMTEWRKITQNWNLNWPRNYKFHLSESWELRKVKKGKVIPSDCGNYLHRSVSLSFHLLRLRRFSTDLLFCNFDVPSFHL